MEKMKMDKAMMEEMHPDAKGGGAAMAKIEITEVPDLADVIDDLTHAISDLTQIKKASPAAMDHPKSIKELRQKVEQKNKYTPEE